MNPSFLLLASLLSLSRGTAAQDAQPDTSRPQRSFRFVYTSAVPEVPAGAKQVRLWVPVRFEMGFPIPGGDEKEAKVGGYHCWAYVWIEGQGWLPVDISEADKHSEKTDYFFGTLDADRVTMTGGRDLNLEPAPAEGPLNFFVYPYAEIDGKKAEGVTKAFKRVNL